MSKAYRDNIPLCFLANEKAVTKLPTTPKLSKRAIKQGNIPTIMDNNEKIQASTKLKQ